MKPEGISQQAWDEALAISAGYSPYHRLTEAIARAIMAATERERERCALIADAEWNEEGAALIRQGSQPSNAIPVIGSIS